MHKLLSILGLSFVLLSSLSAEAAELRIKAYKQETTSSGIHYAFVSLQATDHYMRPEVFEIVVIDTVQDTGASPKVFTNWDSAEAYLESSLAATLLSNINTANGDSYYTSYSVTKVDPAVKDFAQPLNAKLTTLATNLGSGTTGQYIKGDGSLGTYTGGTTPVAYEDLTSRNNPYPIFKHVTVSGGVGVFQLTTDNTSGGAAACANGIIKDSVNITVSDATASYQMGWAFTNSDKTLTVTANKLTTSNILTGILGQAAANSSVLKLTAWCY